MSNFIFKMKDVNNAVESNMELIALSNPRLACDVSIALLEKLKLSCIIFNWIPSVR